MEHTKMSSSQVKKQCHVDIAASKNTSSKKSLTGEHLAYVIKTNAVDT